MSKLYKPTICRHTQLTFKHFITSLRARCPEIEIEAEYADDLSLLGMCLDCDSPAQELVVAHVAYYGFVRTFAQIKPVLDNALRSERDPMESIFTALLEMLSPPLRVFLSQLALFAGGWTAATAATIYNASCAEEWCGELVALNLISTSEVSGVLHYSMSDALQCYLRQRCCEDQWEIWQSLFVAYFAQIAQQAAPHLRYTAVPEWTFRLEAEKENLYAAMEYAQGEQCAALVCNLWKWGFERSEFDRMHDMLLLALSECHPFPEHLEIEAYRAIGVLLSRRGQREFGLCYLENALFLAEERKQTASIAHILHHLGVVHKNIGNYEASEVSHQRSYTLFCEQGDQEGQMLALSGLGILYWAQNRLDEAQSVYSQSAILCTSLQDHMMAAKILSNMGQIAELRKNYEAALQSFTKSIALFRKVESRYDEMICLNNIGVIQSKDGKIRQANEYFRKSLEIAQKYGYESYITFIIASMAESADLAGDSKKAITLFGAYERYRQKFAGWMAKSIEEALDCRIADLRRSVRPRLFAGLWKRGQAMNLDKIMSSFLD